MTAEFNPLKGWQERFPLPESLDNQDFRFFALGLGRRWQIQLVEEIVAWQVKVGEYALGKDKIGKLDTFIGGLGKVKGEKDWLPNLSTQRKGMLTRLAIEEQMHRDQLQP